MHLLAEWPMQLQYIHRRWPREAVPHVAGRDQRTVWQAINMYSLIIKQEWSDGNSQLRQDSKQLIAIDLQRACRILFGTGWGIYTPRYSWEHIDTNCSQYANAADSQLSVTTSELSERYCVRHVAYRVHVLTIMGVTDLKRVEMWSWNTIL